jgi:hypothetical protein
VWGRTTPQRLRGARAGLILATLVVGGMQVALVTGAQGAVDRVDTQTVRALLGARTAQASLIDADRDAIHSFVSGDVVLVGPGQRYQDSIKAASQAIEQVSETGAGDPAQIQSIDAEVVTYTGLIEQADAARRAEAATARAPVRAAVSNQAPLQTAGLGQAYLWYASKTLHAPGGLLDSVRQLGDQQQTRLAARPWWLGTGAVTTGLLGSVLLLAGLVTAQWRLARRFRRIINLPLAVATVCAIGLGSWVTVGLLHVEGGYDHAASADLGPLLGLWQVRSSVTDADGQSGLSVLQRAQCPPGAACESTVTGLDAAVSEALERAVASDTAVPAALSTAVAAPLTGLVEATRLVGDQVASNDTRTAGLTLGQGEQAFNRLDSTLTKTTQTAQNWLEADLQSSRDLPGLLVGAGGVAVLIGFLTFYGFRPRLEEYRT